MFRQMAGSFFEITQQCRRSLKFPVMKKPFFFGEPGQPSSALRIGTGVSGLPSPYSIFGHAKQLAELFQSSLPSQFLHLFAAPIDRLLNHESTSRAVYTFVYIMAYENW